MVGVYMNEFICKNYIFKLAAEYNIRPRKVNNSKDQDDSFKRSYSHNTHVNDDGLVYKPILKKDNNIEVLSETFIKNSPSKEFKKINKAISFKDLSEPLSSTRDDDLNYPPSQSYFDLTYNLEKEAVQEISQLIESFKGSTSLKENEYDDLKSNWYSNHNNLENLEHEQNPKYLKLKEAKEKWTRFLIELLSDKKHVESKLIELTNMSKLAQDINKRVMNKAKQELNSIAEDVTMKEEYTPIDKSSKLNRKNRKTPYIFNSYSNLLDEEDYDSVEKVEKPETRTYVNETAKTTSTRKTKSSTHNHNHNDENEKTTVKRKHKQSKSMKNILDRSQSFNDLNRINYKKMYKKEYRKSFHHAPSKSSFGQPQHAQKSSRLSNSSSNKSKNKKSCKFVLNKRNRCSCDECLTERELERWNNTKSVSLREEVNFNIQDTIEVLPLKLKRQSELYAYKPALETLKGFEQSI